MLLVCASAAAQTPREAKPPAQPLSAPPPQPPTAVPLTSQDVGTFFDGIISQQLQKGDIAGAVVLVVKDGAVLFAKGYGYADVKGRKPVSVESTLFRPGSISKTFTWTAVMQLVEQGRLDLDRDVNTYIDFRIPAPFGKPVTMRHLMTHTPGWEETAKELFVADSAALYPLDRYLRDRLPRQIFAPGTTPAYSNYGAALAGYIVQRVSGVPFADYIEKNIFEPLGMTRSTFRQPLPKELRPMMSEGYARASQPSKSFEFVEATPAGALATTAEDMSHYIIAHLQDGEFKGAHILKPETARLMHSRIFGLVPELNGMAHGFYEETRNGHRIIGHAGDTRWFHSDMHLVPDEKLGFYVSYNSAGKDEGSNRSALWWAFLDRYYPYAPPVAAKVATPMATLRSFAGTYWLSRRSATTLIALTALEQASVMVNADSTITIDASKDAAGNPRRFREIAPLLFREENGQGRIALQKDATGGRTIVTDIPPFVYQSVPVGRNANLVLASGFFAIVMAVLALLLWPIGGLIRRHYKRPLALSPGILRLRLLTRLSLVAFLVFLALLVAWGAATGSNIAVLSSRYDWLIRFMQLFAWLGILGTIVSLVFAWQSWRDRSLWFWSKIWNTLLMLACVCFTWLVVAWHLVKWNLNY